MIGTQKNCVVRPREPQTQRSLQHELSHDHENQRAISHVYKVASSIKDRQKAWKLAYDRYRAKGYIDAHPSGLWYGLYDMLKDTITFTAELEGVPEATLTTVFDSPLGLPAESVCGEALQGLRNSNRKVCELVSLVSLKDQTRTGVKLIMNLFKLAYFAAYKIEGATDIIITVNPRHAPYYKRILLFEQLAQPTACKRMGGALAVGLRLDLTTAAARYHKRYDSLSGARNLFRFFLVEEQRAMRDSIQQQRKQLSGDLLREYFVNIRPLFVNATPKQRAHLKASCPQVKDLACSLGL